jgi:subtilase family serine protease
VPARRLTSLFSIIAGGAAALACGAAPAMAEPYHVTYPGTFAQPPTTAQCEASIQIACYGPPQFQQAYDMKPLYQAGLTGRGETIVIVDSFGSPTIQSDLQTFDQAYGLPNPPSFKIIQPAGAVPPYNPNDPNQPGWGVETSLDVEYAHTMAPGANILLVETPVAETEGVTGFPQIVEAENYVIDHHLGDVISQSFGATEQTFPSAQSIYQLRSAYENAAAHNVTVLAGSGDEGPTGAEADGVDFYPYRVNSWPSSDPLVTSVGGTQLHLDANGNRTAPDNVWNDTQLLGSPAASGGGLSSVFSRPSYQDGVARVVGGARGTPDVSLSAAVNGGANVYIGFSAPGQPAGWYIVGGTSEATPEFSGIVAIADQAAGHPLGLLGPSLYALGDNGPSGINDVIGGNTTVTFTNPDNNQTYTVPGFSAAPSYDLATGLGTPDGARLVYELSRSWHRGRS